MNRHLHKVLSLLPHMPRAFGMVWKSAPKWTIAWLILLTIQGLLPVASVYLTRALVDSLVLSMEGDANWQSFQPILGLVIAMALVLLLGAVLRGITSYVRTAQSELVTDHIAGMIHAQSVALDMAFYDTPAYFDHLHRARYQATSRPMMLLENMGQLFQSTLTFVAMALVLAQYGWWLPLALIVSSLPAFYVVLKQRLRLHRWNICTTADQRRADYYFWLLTARDVAAELRLFDLGERFQDHYRTLRKKLRLERIKLARDQSMAEMTAGLSGLLVTALALIWMVFRTVQGVFSLGDLALFYQAFNQGQQLMRSLLSNLGEIYTNSLFLGDLFEFLDLQPGIEAASVAESDASAGTIEPFDAIRFEQIAFRYPESKRYALQDFDLTIPVGQTVAVVGANGAGKSTLIRLLCRLYDPAAGRILLGERDLTTVDPKALRRLITVLFQQPVQYNAPVNENIILGDPDFDPDPERIRLAAVAAGADTPIDKLPNGYETMLGRWFSGGTDLSVGEWQRVALARAYHRRAPIIVLDEPTSAMDPWAEADWLRRFRTLADGRTALIITHRFTTARYADVIHVMENGRIVESGDHEALLALGGRYAHSWHEQMRPRANHASVTVT